MESFLWGAGLRLAQAAVASAPTIVIGLLVAGVFRRMLGYAGTRKLFGDGSWRSLPQAWAVGMLLPVCSLGVIPIIREMKRAGVSGGAMLAFALTAPLFNPISVLYGLTLSDPVVIFTFSAAALLIVTLVGLAWDRIFAHRDPEPDEPPASRVGVPRLLAVAAHTAREIAGPSLPYILIGLLGVAALSLLLPFGYLQTAAEADDPWAPLFMAAIAIPAYATPMTAMVQLATMFQHGNSVGAAFTLLILGAGANLGVLAWLMKNYGFNRTSAWFAVLLAIVIGLAYGLDKPLYPAGVQAAGHTHAFDIYCHPFPRDLQIEPMQKVLAELQEKTAAFELVGLAGLGICLLAGVLLQLFDRTQRLERWTEQAPDPQTSDSRKWDFVIPGPVLGGISLVGLIVLSVYGCFIYYPAPTESFAEMTQLNTTVAAAATAGEFEAAAASIPIYEDWTRKLEVGLVIRGGKLTDYRRAKADVVREKLELLEHEVEDRSKASSKKLGLELNRAYLRLRRTYEISD